MSHHRINAFGGGTIVTVHFLVGFFQGSLHIAIFGIGDGRFAVLSNFFLYFTLTRVPFRKNLYMVVQLTNDALHLSVILQQFDGEETC